ncbi:olfactomedin-4-like [Engraulis encrasicolus]|uniref:olfactomedin-4-like n=1 Tax=Engraulis encrasicolus TaxID=184585 RepID=UPI002FD1E8ED
MQNVKASHCACELTNVEKPFPKDKLLSIETSAAECNKNIQLAKVSEEASLRLGLHKRLLQLQDEVSVLEQEDDGGLYGAVSLRIIELELAQLLQLINKLNETNIMQENLGRNITVNVLHLRKELKQLEKFDHMQIIQKLEENKGLQRSLAQCQEELQATPPPPTPPPGSCPHGRLVQVDGPKSSSITEHDGYHYHYGSWGQDPKPSHGKEGWYWLVALTKSDTHANYVRLYTSLNALMVGKGHTDVSIDYYNPNTHTIQGPNVVMYGDALYYGCYNTPSVCRFNMTSRKVTTAALPPKSGVNNKFPFCHLGYCYVYTDLDLMTDDSGVWLAYTSAENYGNVMLCQVESGHVPKLGRTLKTSLYKRSATNTFMACGVLYATRYVDKETEEVFYSFDTRTGVERYDLDIRFKKIKANVESLNYNPSDLKLYAYSDSHVVQYDAIFERGI